MCFMLWKRSTNLHWVYSGMISLENSFIDNKGLVYKLYLIVCWPLAECGLSLQVPFLTSVRAVSFPLERLS